MLVYHKTNNEVICTQVTLGASISDVTHGSFIWEKHRDAVDKLINDGDVWVTGGTYASSVYSGKLEPREMFTHYITQ